MMKNKHQGFTLLEILIALFIFTIVSLILVSALHNVIGLQSGAEKNAERLRTLQMTLLMMSRDIEQAVDRPILNTAGKEEVAFIGTPRNFAFTHTGLANPTGMLLRSTLQRTGYEWNHQSLSRMTWPVLDQAPQTRSQSRVLLTNVNEARFSYLDQEGRFHDYWPLAEQSNQTLPKAVRIYLTISPWGKLSQLYVISAESTKTIPSSPQS